MNIIPANCLDAGIPANCLDTGIPANHLIAIMQAVCAGGDYHPVAGNLQEWRPASRHAPACEYSIRLSRHPYLQGYCLLMVSDHAGVADCIVYGVDCDGGLYTYRV
jgi:hypothetical protein|nr:MAG TPA: hypothetical protein [Caudoviricetes sp.]